MMNHIPILLGILMSVVAAGKTDSINLASCDPRSSRIIGGSSVTPNSIPWQVGITYPNRDVPSLLDFLRRNDWLLKSPDLLRGAIDKIRLHNNVIGCGGTLLTDKHVLTAAHCIIMREVLDLDDFPDLNEFDLSFHVSDIVVMVAEHDQFDCRDGIQHPICRMTIHPKYEERRSWDNDFAVLHLTESVALGKQARAACLPNPVSSFSGDALVGEILTVSGWGSMTPINYTHPAVLQSTSVTVISQDDCRDSYGHDRITDSMICVTGDGKRSSCKGDSGGPLTYEKDGKTYLIGVVSWGRACGKYGDPGVYARVTKELKWIEEQLQETC